MLIRRHGSSVMELLNPAFLRKCKIKSLDFLSISVSSHQSISAQPYYVYKRLIIRINIADFEENKKRSG